MWVDGPPTISYTCCDSHPIQTLEINVTFESERKESRCQTCGLFMPVDAQKTEEFRNLDSHMSMAINGGIWIFETRFKRGFCDKKHQPLFN